MVVSFQNPIFTNSANRLGDFSQVKKANQKSTCNIAFKSCTDNDDDGNHPLSLSDKLNIVKAIASIILVLGVFGGAGAYAYFNFLAPPEQTEHMAKFVGKIFEHLGKR